MAKGSSPPILRVFFKSKKGSLNGQAQRPLSDEISSQLKGIGKYLEKLQDRIDSQQKVIKSLLKEMDK
jgi:hypothetical protein